MAAPLITHKGTRDPKRRHRIQLVVDDGQLIALFALIIQGAKLPEVLLFGPDSTPQDYAYGRARVRELVDALRPIVRNIEVEPE